MTSEYWSTEKICSFDRNIEINIKRKSETEQCSSKQKETKKNLVDKIFHLLDWFDQCAIFDKIDKRVSFIHIAELHIRNWNIFCCLNKEQKKKKMKSRIRNIPVILNFKWFAHFKIWRWTTERNVPRRSIGSPHDIQIYMHIHVSLYYIEKITTAFRIHSSNECWKLSIILIDLHVLFLHLFVGYCFWSNNLSQQAD